MVFLFGRGLYPLDPLPEVGVPDGLEVVLEVVVREWHFQGPRLNVHPVIRDVDVPGPNCGSSKILQPSGSRGGCCDTTTGTDSVTRAQVRVPVERYGTVWNTVGVILILILEVTDGLPVVDVGHVDRVLDADGQLGVPVAATAATATADLPLSVGVEGEVLLDVVGLPAEHVVVVGLVLVVHTGVRMI